MPNHPIPLLPLRPVQRIAWLDGVRTLACTADFRAFTAGRTYTIATGLRETAVASERESLAGDPEIVTTHGREFTVTVYEHGTGATGLGRAHHFSDYPPEMLAKNPGKLYPFADLIAHFAIPEVLDIAQTHPAEYQRALAWLADFEQRANRTLPADSKLRGQDGKFTLTAFQREDMARAACIPPHPTTEWNHGGRGGRGDEQRPASSPAALAATAAVHRIRCIQRPSLATLAADCFNYVGADEGVRLKADDSFMSLGVRRMNPARRLVLTGTPVKNQLHDIFWLLEWASHGGAVLAWEQGLGKSLALLFFGLLCDCKRHLLVAPESLHEAIRKTAAAFGMEIRTLDSQLAFQRDPLLQQWQRDHMAGRTSTAAGIWLTSYTQLGQNGADEEIREKPTALADIGVGHTIAYRVPAMNHGERGERGDDAKQGHASSPAATAATAAVQNRFPYPATPEGRAQFAADFMPTEQNHSKAVEHEQATGKQKTFRKRVPGLTNRHRLWRILAGLIFRRTSDEVSTMVKLTHTTVILPPGKAQRDVYRSYVRDYLDTKDRTQLRLKRNVLAILKNLRVAALAPHSRLLTGMRSWTDACPKQAWTLAKIAQLIADGERVVVLSSFTDFGTALHARLTQAGVASVNLDGSTSSAARGRLAEQFKAGQFAVLCGTKASMGEGHSFECAAHLIEPDDDFALDLNLQSPKRVHRINSKRPVTIWHLQTAKTIDARLADDRALKTRTAGLALDLDFIPEEMTPASPGAMLRDAIADFDENAPSTDEQLIEDEWERSLRGKLRGAMEKFREHHPSIAEMKPVTSHQSPVTANVSTKDVRSAMTVLRRGSIVDAIPDGTLRFLAKLPAGASTTALRTEFEQFMVNHRDRNWQTAWPKFEAGRKQRKPRRESVTAQGNKDIPQPKDYRHLGI